MGFLACLLAAVIGFERWIATTDMPSLEPEVSVTVLDREGTLLRAYTVADGLWRLPVTAAEVDRGYLTQLLAYEDKRFHAHSGVDPVALFRAVMNSALAGQVVSGASTLTMQVARLLEDAPTGSLRAKLRQIRLALALERQLPKERILDLYLTLAPFGGNIEGVRAASLSWFGKEPRRLTPAEAALLVALPQSPESRRPDRHPEAAREARDLVLGRVTARGALAADEAAAARREAVPTRRRAFPQLAPHLADRMRRGDPEADRHLTEIDAAMQGRLEDLLRTRARRLDPGLSVALLAVEHESGAVRARIGSPDLLDTTRGGFLDMTRAVRSPGSTLKPLIFGLAFEQGLAHPETLIDDRPMSFGGYDPQNFDRRYYGTVSIRTALQRSLNIPAIAALEAVGPARLLSRLRRAGAKPILPPGGVPGLAIGLGGLGVTLEDLVTVYAAMARGGEAVSLQDARMPEAKALPAAPVSVLSPEAAWYVGDILAGVAAPENAPQDAIAFKTGTSYGHRDAWAVGFDGRHTVGIWVGRPDGAAAPGTLGIDSAAPLLFEAFARLKSIPDPFGPPPKGALRVGQAELPQPLKRFRSAGTPQRRTTPAPRIAFPPDGATVDLGIADGMEAPFLALKLRDGRPPFAWLVDGHPVDADPFAREVLFEPDGPGFLSISVIDAGGQAARSRVRLE